MERSALKIPHGKVVFTSICLIALLLFSACNKAKFTEIIHLDNNRWEVGSIHKITAKFDKPTTVKTIEVDIRYLHGTQITQFELAMNFQANGQQEVAKVKVDLTEQADCVGDLCDKKVTIPLQHVVDTQQATVQFSPITDKNAYIPNIQSVQVCLN